MGKEIYLNRKKTNYADPSFTQWTEKDTKNKSRKKKMNPQNVNPNFIMNHVRGISFFHRSFETTCGIEIEKL